MFEKFKNIFGYLIIIFIFKQPYLTFFYVLSVNLLKLNQRYDESVLT